MIKKSLSLRIGLDCVLSLFVLLLSACSTPPAPSPRQIPESVYKPPPYRPSPPAESCKKFFDPCICNIQEYPISTLDQQLSQPGWSTYRRQELTANISNVADHYKSEYWRSKSLDSALRALRYYDAYLGLIPLSEPSAPFALLHSIALYCDLGCWSKAQALSGELRGNHRNKYKQADLDVAFRACR